MVARSLTTTTPSVHHAARLSASLSLSLSPHVPLFPDCDARIITFIVCYLFFIWFASQHKTHSTDSAQQLDAWTKDGQCTGFSDAEQLLLNGGEPIIMLDRRRAIDWSRPPSVAVTVTICCLYCCCVALAAVAAAVAAAACGCYGSAVCWYCWLLGLSLPNAACRSCRCCCWCCCPSDCGRRSAMATAVCAAMRWTQTMATSAAAAAAAAAAPVADSDTAAASACS